MCYSILLRLGHEGVQERLVRTIILYRTSERAFFIYGYAKRDRENIHDDEAVEFKKTAAHVLRLSEEHLAELIHNGQFSEVHDYGTEISE